MRNTVFWSWQSDLPGNVTRNFIKQALDRAIKKVSTELELQPSERLEIDHDTKDEAGLVEIVTTIFRKIDDCQIFVADITPVATTTVGNIAKKIPNPNVMIELGYAMREVGPQRIITITNLAFGGSPEDLPFDLRHRRGPITFDLKNHGDVNAKDVSKQLTNSLAAAILGNLKEKREEQATRNPVPRLSIQATEGCAMISVDQTPVDMSDVPGLDEIMTKTPKKKPEEQDYSPTLAEQISKLQPFLLSGQTRYKPFRDWDREEIDGYNSCVEHYYERYEHYLNKLNEHRLLMRRCAEIQLIIANNGVKPATNIWAEISFPEGIKLYEPEDKPKAPTPPSPPEFAPHGRRSSIMAYSQERHLNIGQQPRIREDGRSMLFRATRIPHGFELKVPPFIIEMSSPSDIHPFSVKYEAGADEMPQSANGNIAFDVQLMSESA